MEEKIAQLEEKLNQLELLEHQVRATFLSVSDEAKNREKYEYGQLVPYLPEEKMVCMPEHNLNIIREKTYKSYDAMPEVYKDFHSFAEYVEGHSAPHGYPNKEYDLGVNTRFSGIMMELMVSALLAVIGGLVFGFPVTWLTDFPFWKSFALVALGFGILFTISAMRDKIRQNNAKEPLDDTDYLIEKAKYEAIVDERNKKLAAERVILAECNKKLDEISKAKNAIKEGLKILKKDGN